MTTNNTERPLAGIAIAAFGGLCLAVQSRLNGELGAGLGDGVAAATFSFGLGLVVLLLVVPLLPSARRGLSNLRRALRERRIAWWQCIGGLSGAWLVTTQGLIVGILGVAVFTVAIVAGQAVSSLFVDRFGLGPAGPQALNVWRLAGAALAVVAVVISVSADLGTPSALGLAVLPLIAGVSTSVQQAFNGRVREAANSAAIATLGNFVVGTIALIIALAVEVSVRGLPTGSEQHWWAYLGGPLGIGMILSAAVAVRLVGVLLVGLASVAGQLIGALGVDLVAPAAGHTLALSSILGTGLILVAVLIAALPTLRGRDRAESTA